MSAAYTKLRPISETSTSTPADTDLIDTADPPGVVGVVLGCVVGVIVELGVVIVEFVTDGVTVEFVAGVMVELVVIVELVLGVTVVLVTGLGLVV